MRLKLDKRFKNNIKGVFEKYEFEVGILNDAKYRKAKRGERGQKGQDVLTTFAGTKVRQATMKRTSTSMTEISREMRREYDYLQKPFKKMSTEMRRLIKDFFEFSFGRTEAKRLENTLQAIVRNPILKRKYGSNSELTQKIKGFDHPMIDTAQFFKAIEAKVKRVRRR